ncbi:hypothetical protein BC936DRAFT_146227 [Jimgerdemannia flammicorona]|uniref:Uncharacterized protein n=1 Tax=Jimgerdemannia flammicorona TaxID=994334 RepID=A0A433D859_9FUNG|nr:hypothetical protein BC936DRAFT_146227 [Jimgerdemannia flammicorona]
MKDQRLLKSTGSSVHFHNSTFLGNAQRVETINNGTSGQQGKRKLYRKSTYADNVNSDHGEDEDSEEDDVGESSTSESDNSSETEASFVKTYKDMDPARKWVLSSGTVVEDVIFRKYKNMSVELLAHSWVIDLNNHEVASLFSPADWKEISSQTLSLPQFDVLTAKSVSRFAKVTMTSGLREVLETTSYRSKDELYDREKHYDAEWVDLVMRRMLPLFESPDQLLQKPHLEGWYDSNIWSFIVDYALQDLKGMETVRYVPSDRFVCVCAHTSDILISYRKESSSLATTMRKNRKRVRTGKEDRSKIGRRLDAIIKTDADAYYEYGAVEVAKSFRGVKSTKWLTDSLKLAKTLHDMLFRLEELVDHQDSLVKKLRVVGLVNSGLKCQILQMSHPNGYVCLLERNELLEVPTVVENLRDLFMLLKGIWQMKKMIRDCAAVVNSRHIPNTEEELFTELTDGGLKSPPRATTIPWSFDTPTKRKY